MRAREISWPWYTRRTSLGARRPTREKKTSGTQGLVGDAWGVELITACVVAYPGASDFLREFAFLKLFPVSSMPSRLMPLTRNASAARNNET